VADPTDLARLTGSEREAYEYGRIVGAGDMERIEREARADELEAWAAATLRRANEVRANVGLDAPRIDVVHADGTHEYYSTHCRHDRHDDCSASEVRGTATRFAGSRGTWPVTTFTERKPAQCKTCAAPCICPCHQEADRG
jgi:hypothetical protein